MTRTTRVLAPVLLLAAAGSASGGSFASTWKAPDAQPLNLQGKKVVALIISKDGPGRRAAEDLLSYHLTERGTKGIPAYALVPPDATQDREKAKAAFEKADVKGVVSMRVVGKKQEQSYEPGSAWAVPYGSFWGGAGGGYYSWGWSDLYDPSYLRNDTVVTVETLVYSLEQDKLIWAGRSKTSNPDGATALVRELVDKVAKELRKQGLIGGGAK